MRHRTEFDVLVVGAGTGGIPCAVTAAEAGARVLLVEADDRVGGTLHVSGGHLSAAGARRQRERGIADDDAAHLSDIERISEGTARNPLVRIAVEHAAETVDWLDDAGFEFDERTPRIVHGHEPYSAARTYYGVGEGRSILTVLERLLRPHLDSGAVTLWLRARVVRLLQEGDAVVGAVVQRDGARHEVRAPAVVLATGGFGAEPHLFAELEGAPLVSAAHPTSTGDGVALARQVGGAIAGQGMYLPTFGGLPHPQDPGRVQWSDRPLLVAAERTPWEIYVDLGGRRFVAEDEPSIDLKERILAGLKDLVFFQVFDDAAVALSPNIVLGWSPDDLRARVRERPGLFVADSIAALAEQAGIDADALQATVERYNDDVRRNRPDELGRNARPTTIDHPPYYALRNHGITLVTFAGVDVDPELRVRRADGSLVPGLYALGEVIGAAATMGNSFCGGMCVTPALTFARLLGPRLARPSGDTA